MKSLLIRILIVVLLFFGFKWIMDQTYIEFRPHYLTSNNKTRYYGESELDSVMYRNIRHVFEVYDVDYKVEGENKILIKRSLNEDWELLWNYTSKADDSIWLKEHTR